MIGFTRTTESWWWTQHEPRVLSLSPLHLSKSQQLRWLPGCSSIKVTRGSLKKRLLLLVSLRSQSSRQVYQSMLSPPRSSSLSLNWTPLIHLQSKRCSPKSSPHGSKLSTHLPLKCSLPIRRLRIKLQVPRTSWSILRAGWQSTTSKALYWLVRNKVIKRQQT